MSVGHKNGIFSLILIRAVNSQIRSKIKCYERITYILEETYYAQFAQLKYKYEQYASKKSGHTSPSDSVKEILTCPNHDASVLIVQQYSTSIVTQLVHRTLSC